MIVTTGGQQVIDLVCKTLIDPGDVIVAEAPTYPGAVPTFSAYQADVVQIEMDADGMPIDELERTLDRLQAQGRRPKFIYTIPNFQNPGGVTMSLARRRRLVEVARERELLVLEDNPYGLLRYEGEPLPTLYSLDAEALGRGGASDLVIYLGTFSKILSPGLRLGWAVAPRPVLEKLNLGKQGADLCSSPVTQMFVGGVLRRAGTRRARRPGWSTSSAARALPSPPRRDARVAAGALRRQRALDDARRAGCSSGRRSTSGSTRPTCWRSRARARASRSCPGARRTWTGARRLLDAPELRRASRSEDIREGIRRIGKVVRDQLGLLGTLTGSPGAGAAVPGGSAGAAGRAGGGGGDPARPLGRRGRARRAARRSGEPVARSDRIDESAAKRVAVLKGGRSLERTVSLRSGAQAQDALPRLGHEVVAIDVGPRRGRQSCRAAARRGVRRAARPRRRGRDRAGAAGGDRRCPTRAPDRRRACAAPTRCWQST